MNLNDLEKEIEEKIKQINTLDDIEKIKREYLSQNGKIRELFKEIAKLPLEIRKETGIKINFLKEKLEKEIENKKTEIENQKIEKSLREEKIDITRLIKKQRVGHLHPLTIELEKIINIFNSLGFELAQGPEIETEWYNFDALCIPKNHPARDMWDTLWLKEEGLLLRTHTSPVQIRYMENNNPPFKTIVPGRVFRYEATDASHEINFHQIEGLMVDKLVSVANFKAIINAFLRSFFDKDIEIRMRPSYFPFTEPSFEIDIKRKKGKWLEIMGAGLVHPQVFKNAKLNPKDWQGFAFGMGLERLTMIKYNIKDIRLFYSNDLRFLKQF